MLPASVPVMSTDVSSSSLNGFITAQAPEVGQIHQRSPARRHRRQSACARGRPCCAVGLGRPFKRLPGLLVQVDVQRPAFLHCSSPKQKGAPRAKRETLPICDTYAILLENVKYPMGVCWHRMSRALGGRYRAWTRWPKGIAPPGTEKRARAVGVD